MKHPIVICFALISSCLLLDCKKRDEKKDEVTSHFISGTVMNKCTDEGASGYPVKFIVYNDGTTKELTTTSGPEGRFKCGNAEIHSNNKYMYQLEIESYRITSPHS